MRLLFVVLQPLKSSLLSDEGQAQRALDKGLVSLLSPPLLLWWSTTFNVPFENHAA